MDLVQRALKAYENLKLGDDKESLWLVRHLIEQIKEHQRRINILKADIRDLDREYALLEYDYLFATEKDIDHQATQTE